MDFLAHVRAESARLGEVARTGLGAAVPSCPGWMVDDLVRHVALVYIHKVEVLRIGSLPDPWPPDFSGHQTLQWYDDARHRLVDALEQAGTATPTWTFSPRDSTSGFWHRRMVHETLVHRIDAEQAHDAVTPIDPDLALDGIDEILYPTLAGPWWEEGDTEYPIDATLRLTAAGRSWTVYADATRVDVRDGTQGDVAAEISGDPADLYLWLWGRQGEDSIDITGDPDIPRAFRGRISEAAQ
jgi:uncharacterized protein (TIGR03083 family)